MTRTARTTSALRIAAATAVTALVLTGCSAVEDLFGGDDEPDRNDDGEVSEVVESASIFDIAVGDCIGPFEEDGEGSIEEVDIFPCDEEYAQQVFSITQIDAEELPDEETVQQQASEDCVPAFKEFVGAAPEQSELEISYLSPSQESWDSQDDRDIVCTVYDPNGNVTGSLKDSAKKQGSGEGEGEGEGEGSGEGEGNGEGEG